MSSRFAICLTLQTRLKQNLADYRPSLHVVFAICEHFGYADDLAALGGTEVVSVDLVAIHQFDVQQSVTQHTAQSVNIA